MDVTRPAGQEHMAASFVGENTLGLRWDGSGGRLRRWLLLLQGPR